MSGQFTGVQSIIRQQFPKAVYVHCSAHSLNALCHCCSVSPVRNCIGTIGTVINFFRSSAKRTEHFKSTVSQEISTETTASTLAGLCETRWVEKHDAVMRFLDLYKPIVSSLEVLETDGNTDTSTKASQLLNAVTKSDFVVSLCILKKLFSLTLPLSKTLKKID
jgi:hypothetical protein